MSRLLWLLGVLMCRVLLMGWLMCSLLMVGMLLCNLWLLGLVLRRLLMQPFMGSLLCSHMLSSFPPSLFDVSSFTNYMDTLCLKNWYQGATRFKAPDLLWCICCWFLPFINYCMLLISLKHPWIVLFFAGCCIISCYTFSAMYHNSSP